MKIKNIAYLKKIFVTLFLLLNSFLFASNFTQTITTTAETCSGNGSAIINITGANAGVSQFTFSIYNNGTLVLTQNLSGGNPQTITPSTTNFSYTISGFTAGTYQLETTEYDNGITKVVKNNITIADQKKNMAVSVSEDLCTGANLIATLTKSSYDPYIYTLLDSGGNILETSPSTTALAYNFTSVLANGTYTVSVKDLCGNQQIGSYVVNKPTYSYDLLFKHGTQLSDCNTKKYDLGLRFFKNGSLSSI